MAPSTKVIETIGNITKYEQLKSVDKYVLPDTLVLKNPNPFPGFDLQGANMHNPASIFLILRYRYAPEKIIHITRQLRQNSQFKCNAGYGEIKINNTILPCIRIKGLTCISQIPVVQEFYKSNEIRFLNYKRIDAFGKIRIFKTFKIIELDKGLYRDYYEPEKFYFSIPHELDWKEFEKLTDEIRSKLKNPRFDAALGNIYRYMGPEDIIRIYDKNKSLERAYEIQQNYLKVLKKEEAYNME